MWFSIKYYIISFILSICIASLYSQVPLNWTIDEVNPGEDVSLFPDETVYTDGLKSCRMQLHSGAVPYLISDFFYIPPGADYEFSIDVFDNDTAGQVKVYADFYDTYGFNIFGEPPIFSADSGQWQTISWQGSIPEQAVVGYILVKFYCQPNLYSFTKTSDIIIDNVRFLASGGENLVVNGSFEEWVVGMDDKEIKVERFTIYPNPARYFVNVNLLEAADYLVISDLSARVVLEMQITGMIICRIKIDQLPDGIYFITAFSHNKAIGAGLFYKSK